MPLTFVLGGRGAIVLAAAREDKEAAVMSKKFVMIWLGGYLHASLLVASVSSAASQSLYGMYAGTSGIGGATFSLFTSPRSKYPNSPTPWHLEG
jgi:hypothetical protein